MDKKDGTGNLDRRVFLVPAGLAALILLAFVVRNVAFASCPLSNHMTLSELQNMDLRVRYVEDSADWSEDQLRTFADRQMEGAERCENIFIAKPTGNIYFNRGIRMEEVCVKEVLRGTCDYEKIWLGRVGATLVYEDGKVQVQSNRSFMQEDCEYLLFCNPSGANAYSDKKVFWEEDTMWFACYNITRDSDVILHGSEDRYDPQIEFYTNSREILECFNEAKRRMLW